MKVGLIGAVHATDGGGAGLTIKMADGRYVDIRGELPPVWCEQLEKLKAGELLILELRTR